MRKFLAAWMLLCLGMFIPLGASSMRLCLLDGDLSRAHGELACCSECAAEEDAPSPCCVEFEKLPDASAPFPPLLIPAVLWTGLPPLLAVPPVSVERSQAGFSPSEPILGPSSPAAYRAVLSIWSV